YQQAYSYPLTF
nr:immunoglobulin light chain junction region [Macaca mulatta]